jgi:hypothetical protein
MNPARLCEQSVLRINIKNVRKKEHMPDRIRIHMKESVEDLGKVLDLLRAPTGKKLKK